MNAERWQHVTQLFEAVLERPVSERAAFLASACERNDALRREVESLLAQEERNGPLDRPVYVADDLLPGGAVLAEGSSVGPYRIEGIIGAGGMGEVYRAHDSKLGRPVALKVLPSRFAADPERLARFKREAQALATLNHPNIGAIYGLEDAGDVQALVLELVDGDTLSDRIGRQPMPLDEAIPIARQIAEALAAAHERGVIHRDLKPPNIKVSRDGIVKVLDFGLARLTQQDELPPADATMSPTIASPAVMTAAGIILGTAAYMAPEQAKSRPADQRSDIWAFGCVLFEMLTGRRAFDGEDVGETLAAVLRAEPDFDLLPATTPESVSGLIRKCLAKNPRERLQHIGDTRFDLRESAGDTRVLVRRRTTVLREWLAWSVASVALIALAIIASWPRSSAQSRETHVELMTPPTTDPASFAISPDGRTVAYVAERDGVASLWMRSLDHFSSERRLPNTERSANPFWSPNGRSLGFFADQAVKRVDVDAGTVRTLARASGSNNGGTWTRDDVILFVPTDGSRVMLVSATGGEATPVLGDSGGLQFVSFPYMLPDDRHFLCFAVDDSGRWGAHIGVRDGSELERLVDSDSAPVFLNDHLLFVRGGTLLAQPFDPEALRMSGVAYKIADRVFMNAKAKAAVAVSPSGSLLYRSDVADERRQLTWFNRKGELLRRVGEPFASLHPLSPALSPDDTRVVLTRFIGDENLDDIWIVDLARGVFNKLTNDRGSDTSPIWLDNESILFSRNTSQVVRKRAAASSAPEEIIAQTTRVSGRSKAVDPTGTVSDLSRDGRYLLSRLPTDRNGYDILARDLRDGGPGFGVVETAANELDGQFAPNGRWIAYQSDQTGQYDIYLQAFRDPRKQEIRVSVSGGTQVRWRRDGTELFYIALNGMLMAVPITFGPTGETAIPGTAVPLFHTAVGAAPGLGRQQYMVSSDGQRFLMNTVVAPPAASPLKLIQNWSPASR